MNIFVPLVTSFTCPTLAQERDLLLHIIRNEANWQDRNWSKNPSTKSSQETGVYSVPRITVCKDTPIKPHRHHTPFLVIAD